MSCCANIFDNFGLGQLTGIEAQEELPGLLPTAEWKKKTHGNSWYPGDTLISSIGQGYLLVTPLQLAKVAATLANHGQGFQPTLLLKTKKANNIVINQTAKPLTPIKINDDHWDIILNAMHDIAHNPSGSANKYYQGSSYEIAAKTGTAQVYSLKKNEKYNAKLIAEKLRDHSLFIAFAPYDNPKIAIGLIVENSPEPASKIARKVLDYYLKKEQ